MTGLSFVREASSDKERTVNMDERKYKINKSRDEEVDHGKSSASNSSNRTNRTNSSASASQQQHRDTR